MGPSFRVLVDCLPEALMGPKEERDAAGITPRPSALLKRELQAAPGWVASLGGGAWLGPLSPRI